MSSQEDGSRGRMTSSRLSRAQRHMADREKRRNRTSMDPPGQNARPTLTKTSVGSDFDPSGSVSSNNTGTSMDSGQKNAMRTSSNSSKTSNVGLSEKNPAGRSMMVHRPNQRQQHPKSKQQQQQQQEPFNPQFKNVQNQQAQQSHPHTGASQTPSTGNPMHKASKPVTNNIEWDTSPFPQVNYDTEKRSSIQNTSSRDSSVGSNASFSMSTSSSANASSRHATQTQSKPIMTPMPSNNAPNLFSGASLKMKSNSSKSQTISVESPLPPLVHRNLGDRSYEKRKNAALEVETLVKSLVDATNTGNGNQLNSDAPSKMINNPNTPMIASLVQVLSKDFCTSMNSNFRKGGLIGLAATAIGLMPDHTPLFLDELLRPVLHCFDDPEARVRYYACESLYNISKVARGAILIHFNQIFDGLTKLFADVDADVKNGANLLDRLIKDIVTESENFNVELFLPMLQNYIRRSNPFIRQLLVGWITVLDGLPDVNMIDYLPDFLDGLFNMLSDSNREIRQAADSALCEFLKDMQSSTVMEFGPIVSILVLQCHAKERLNRLTAITWLADLINHPHSGGDSLQPFYALVLGAILRCISDNEIEIRKVSERTNLELLHFVKDTTDTFDLSPILETLTKDLLGKDDVPTKLACLRWINMLLEKRRTDMDPFIQGELLPALLKTLNDKSDAVLLLDLQVLSRVSLPQLPSTLNIKTDLDKSGAKTPYEDHLENMAKRKELTKMEESDQFQMVLKAIIDNFASDRNLLEKRGSLIVRKLCVLLNAKSVYIRMAKILSNYGSFSENDAFALEFVATMVQTLNLILLTAAELHSLRVTLAETFALKHSLTVDALTTESGPNHKTGHMKSPNKMLPKQSEIENEGVQVFESLFNCWCHNPVATFSLCLLARAFDIAFALVKKFSELEVTVGFLMQVDKLVHLLESPIFVHLRLQLLHVEAPYHTQLLKSCYGLLMLLPQSDAFRSLNDRLTTVCNLRDNLGIKPGTIASPAEGVTNTQFSSLSQSGMDSNVLLARFDDIMAKHRKARELIQKQTIQQDLSNMSSIHRKSEAISLEKPPQIPTTFKSGNSAPQSLKIQLDKSNQNSAQATNNSIPNRGL